jgi:hypothetical protein
MKQKNCTVLFIERGAIFFAVQFFISKPEQRKKSLSGEETCGQTCRCLFIGDDEDICVVLKN